MRNCHIFLHQENCHDLTKLLRLLLSNLKQLKSINHVALYSRRRIYQYNEDNVLFQFGFKTTWIRKKRGAK